MVPNMLARLPLHNMAAINEKDRFPILISLKFIPESPIDNKPAMVQVMAWRRTGGKP